MKHGNFVPADCRLLESYNLKIDESALTGEILPVLKNADIDLNEEINSSDIVNMAYATTMITNGHAKAVVTSIGMETKVGSIAKAIIEDEAPQTPIQKKLEEVRENTWYCVSNNMWTDIFDRSIQTHISKRNVFNLNRTCCCSNTRGVASNSYNNVVNRRNKNGKEKCYN